MHIYVHTYSVCCKTGTGGPFLLAEKQSPSPRGPIWVLRCLPPTGQLGAPRLDGLLPLHKAPVHLPPPM